MLVVDLYSPHD